MQIARVALDVPLHRLFDYRVPDDEPLSACDIGRRVRVPFGARSRIGILVDLQAASDFPLAQLKSIEAVLRDLPALPPEWSGRYAGILQMGVDALPVNACALQNSPSHTPLAKPVRQGLQVVLETAKFPLVLDELGTIVLDQDRHDVFHAIHVDAGHPFVKDILDSSPVVTLQCVGDGRQTRQLRLAAEIAAGLFTVRHLQTAQGTIGGTDCPSRVQLN